MPIYKTGKSKDGRAGYRVVVNYTDAQGNYKQRSKIAYGLTDAKQAEIELSSRSSESSGSMTVEELFEQYIASCSHDIRASTLDKRIRILKLHVLPKLGKTKLSRLTVAVLQAWRDDLAQTELKTVTLNNIYRELNAMLNFAERVELVPKNLLKKVKNFRDPYFEAEPEKLHYYTVEQWRLFEATLIADAAEQSDWRYYVLFSVLFYSGTRKGEAYALKWSDIDGSVMHVRRSVTNKVKGGIQETPPKNKSSYRDIIMPDKLAAVLADEKARQMNDPKFTEDYRVCGGAKIIGDSSCGSKGFEIAGRAGLPHIRLHDFRHTHATLLINEGINVQEIARRLGHSNVQQTLKTYAHLYPREEERALRVLNSIG